MDASGARIAPGTGGAPDWIARYLDEDLGPDGLAGDVTSVAVIPADQIGAARIIAREPCILAGGEAVREVFRRVGVTVEARLRDGGRLAAGEVSHVVRGPARGILAGERLALNIVARMSGIATLTRRLQDALVAAGSGAKVAATRKTTPGFRWLEKEAVRIGGGDPHRLGLFDVAMIKDNHLAAAGSVRDAVARVRQHAPGIHVIVEVESLADLRAAAQAGADRILIDNRPPGEGATWAAEARAIHPGVLIEASGGIRPDDVTEFAYADLISMGWLTQKVAAVDFGLDWGA